MPIAQLDYPHVKVLMDVTHSKEQQYRIHACQKEPWTAAWIGAMPAGSLLWDVGANVGPYTLVALARGLRAVAIEPGYENVAKLQRNLALNGWLDRAFVFGCALGAGSGFLWLHYNDLAPGAASHVINDSPRKISHHKQPVEVRTLDEIAAKVDNGGPWFLKVDVDGGELQVLAGAHGFLRSEHLASVMIEVPDAGAEDIAAQLTAAGLTLANKWDKRDGKSIGALSYQEWRRA